MAVVCCYPVIAVRSLPYFTLVLDIARFRVVPTPASLPHWLSRTPPLSRRHPARYSSILRPSPTSFTFASALRPCSKSGTGKTRRDVIHTLKVIEKLSHFSMPQHAGNDAQVAEKSKII